MFGFLKRANVDPKKRLAKLMGDYDLPSFPGVVLEALQEIRDEDASARSVAKVISQDPGLSVHLLRLVNSAGFGSARKTESVQQAVSMLGMSKVEMLVLAIGVRTALPASDVPGFEVRRFWRTAARRAEVAGAFAQELHPATRSLSFTAALLGDMAVPLLADCPSIAYSPLLKQWHQGGDPSRSSSRTLWAATTAKWPPGSATSGTSPRSSPRPSGDTTGTRRCAARTPSC
jgi:HD-like signal output (HDOD) protein